MQQQIQQKKTIHYSQNKQLNGLITTYFTARAACDVDTLKKLVIPSESISEWRLQKEATYIEKYCGIQCYTLPGPVKNTWIVYVTEKVKLKGIETLAPGMVRLYVCKSSDGQLYIQFTKQKKEIQKKIDASEKEKSVRRLIQKVNRAFQVARKQDQDLNLFLKYL